MNDQNCRFLFIGLMSLPLLLAGCDSKSVDSDLTADSGDPDTGLDAGGDTLAEDLAVDLQLPDSNPPPTTWVAGASMAEKRSFHTATLLEDGRLLVVGGQDLSTTLQSAEVYDPGTGSWSSAGETLKPHWGHSAHLLEDGRVMIVGGCSSASSFTCMLDTGTELFDPAAAAGEQWTEGPPMAVERRSHCSTMLQDGRLLVAGGYDNLIDHKSFEIFDPVTNSWASPAATLNKARNQCAATLLASGKVLISGGNDIDGFHDSLEVFDPAKGSLSMPTAKLSQARGGHNALLLPDSRVLFVGGLCRLYVQDTCQIDSAEIFDPMTDTITGAGTPHFTEGAKAVLLSGGEVLVTGGLLEETTAKLLDKNLMAWTLLPPTPSSHMHHTATVLAGNDVILTGGQGSLAFEGTTAVDLLQ